MKYPSKERLVDEMAVTLCDVAELSDDRICMRALQAAGFPELVILCHLAVARRLARMARAHEADLWHAIDADRTKDRAP